jgi:hypothetical protein
MFQRFELLPSSGIALKMEAVCTSETLVNFNVTTWRYIPEDSKLQFRGLCAETP